MNKAKFIVLKNISRIVNQEARQHLLRRCKDQIKSVIVFVLKYADRLKRLLLYIIMLLFTTMLFSSTAFAAGSPDVSSETQFGLALAFAGVTTALTLVFSTRYVLLGGSLSDIADKTSGAFTGLCKKYIGETKPASSGTSGSAPDVTPGEIELAADRILDRLGKTMDARVDRLNPVTYAEGVKDKMVAFIKRVIQNSNADRTGEWIGDLGDKVDHLPGEQKIKVQSAIQTLARDLERQGADVGEAFEKIDLDTMEAMADFACVTVSRSSVGGDMPSVMEPLCFQYSLIYPIFVLILKLAPFSLYIWIRTKVMLGF